LAESGGEAECLATVCDGNYRVRHPFHKRPLWSCSIETREESRKPKKIKFGKNILNDLILLHFCRTDLQVVDYE
jgi:hypothetical protein